MSDLSQLTIPSLRGKVSAEEWQTRVDLAACYRLVALHGMPDEKAVALTHERFKPGNRLTAGKIEWPALLRMLDRRDPSFRE